MLAVDKAKFSLPVPTTLAAPAQHFIHWMKQSRPFGARTQSCCTCKCYAQMGRATMHPLPRGGRNFDLNGQHSKR
eukprot:544357-Pelagomonas_calceolata.AAC.3